MILSYAYSSVGFIDRLYGDSFENRNRDSDKDYIDILMFSPYLLQ